MNNPWDQWRPYWWQTATAAPALGVQPTEGWKPLSLDTCDRAIRREQRDSRTTPAAAE